MSDINDVDIWQPSSILGTNVNSTNNTISLQTGFVTSNNQIGPTVQLWQQVGIASIPALPEPGIGSAESINLIRTNGDISVATRDIRTQNIYGNLGPGEVCLYATGPVASPDLQGQARVILKGNGSVTLYTTTNNIPSGVGANTIAGPGMYLTLDPQKGLIFSSPFGGFVFDQTGFHIKTVTGCSFDMTNLSSVPIGGLPGMVNSISMTSSIATINSNLINLGPDVTSGGLGYLPAVVSLIPPGPVPGVPPMIGVGVGAVALPTLQSSKVNISI